MSLRVRTLLSASLTPLIALALGLASCTDLPPQAAPGPGSGNAAPPAHQVTAPPASAARLGAPRAAPAPPETPGATPHVALLLPLTGRQANAAATIRDGFLTAYYVSPTADRPRVRLYDTGATSISEAVDDAVRAGAQFIVGPLTREEVAAAAQLPAPRPPILALNFLPADSEAPARFYQFALSPEDEAREVAQRILADGHRHGVALAPDGDWGTRVLGAFRDALTAGGGSVLEAARFEPARTSYAPAITDVLHIDESTARLKRIESVVGGKLQSQPRRRADIDFIFAPSSAAAARLLTPQLKYYFAGNVPTYATSEAFEPNPTANEDLDGLRFPDMPWMLGSGLADSVRMAAQAAWPAGGPPRNRLFAFGFDAYRLLAALRAAPAATPAPTATVEGLTGQLTLDPAGRIHRELEWAQLRDGQPHLLPPPAAASAPAGTEPSPTDGAHPPSAAPVAPSSAPPQSPPAGPPAPRTPG